MRCCRFHLVVGVPENKYHNLPVDGGVQWIYVGCLLDTSSLQGN